MLINLLALFLLACLYLVSFRLNKRYACLFPLFHFLGGFLMAILMMSYFKSWLLVLAAVFMIGILWELWELAIDKIIPLRNFIMKHLGIKETVLNWKDTIFDLIMDLSGAIFFIILNR